MNVSLSGYYGYIQRKNDYIEFEKKYCEQIKQFFLESRRTYGVDRICGVLRKNGYKASYDRVKELMEKMKLKSVHCQRKQKGLTNSLDSRGEGFPNLVKGIEIFWPLSALSSDISYIRTREGFGYICQIRDIASGVILGESMSNNMKSDLVINAIKQAVKRWRLPKGTIFHSDRGSQYTSEAVKELLKKYNLRQSFSRVGKPGDNAWSESFFANLKKERVHWHHFNTIDEAKQAIFEYIEVFYNRKRVQKRLGYLSPIQWLKQWQKEEKKLVA